MSAGAKPGLSQRGFANRHRFALLLLWAEVPALAAVGLALGEPALEVVFTSSIFIAFALGGMTFRNRRLAAVTVALGLLTTSGIVTHYVGGADLTQFHFLLMICVVSFYRDLTTLAIAAISAAAYHFVTIGLGAGGSTAEALTHSAVILALSMLLVIGWRLTNATTTLDGLGTRFRASFEEAPIGMAVLQPSGELLEVNRAMSRILEVDQASLVGTNIARLVHADDQADLGEAWEEIGNGDSHAATVWMRWLTAVGRPLWGRVSLSLVQRSADHPAMVILQLEDATSQHEEKRRLETLLRGKDQFVAAVGDEIRQPLDVVIDLTNGGGDPTETLPRIGARAKEIASIVDDLIVSAGVNPMSVAGHALDVTELCREVIAGLPDGDDVQTDFRARGIWADPALTRQILNGLVGNALRYGGRNVTVRTVTSGPDTVVQVIDDGPAIPDQERLRLFNGDMSSGQPVTRPAVVGLSLTVGRRLARRMDGDIVYRRTPEGQNVFELRLPSEQIREIPRRRGVIQPDVAV